MEVQVLSSAQSEAIGLEVRLEPEVGSGGLGVLPCRKSFKTVGFESAGVAEQ